MMGLFGNKGPTIGEEDENPAEKEVEEVKPKEEARKFGGGVDVELAKITGKLDSLSEMRKASTERFSLINEQIGELRGMITDLNQQFSKVEVGATKAIEKVDSVQPETFMTELRKNEGKIDALKANLESNESLMQDLMKEIKEMRHKMDLYKGTEQIINLHEEVKNELANTKKTEALMERHANRVETIFLDLEKKFSDFDKFDSIVKDLARQFIKIQADFDKMRVKTDTKADKKEFVDLVNKFNDFEKHTGNIIKLLDERSKHVKDDIKLTFENIKEQLGEKFGVKVEYKETKEKELKDVDKKDKGIMGIFKKKGDKVGEEAGKEKSGESSEEPAPELPGSDDDSAEEKKPAEGGEETPAEEGEKPAGEGETKEGGLEEIPVTEGGEGAPETVSEGAEPKPEGGDEADKPTKWGDSGDDSLEASVEAEQKPEDEGSEEKPPEQ
jgi:hypothetical protein